ncbi:phosphonate metabolism protein/1,5-bisphosphokinase (PRPP-forming) PhnN [Bordetella genomosp. 13]|uniref:phosphonate metabolism protein/1,5-bisphosphokinase (PRPP-forming) PhnN n=1 Tax=Bordetella genomosp. 13 TaxID=463040 RepID=UPI0028D65CF2|nr:phosphonate metabolism protein/1,5-bisphosphokinase (PRPP-forming) PhnN [Bordetella genomosp. 13]
MNGQDRRDGECVSAQGRENSDYRGAEHESMLARPRGRSKGQCHEHAWDPASTETARSDASGARLVYLMGPSGSGKDTLLRLLRESLGPADPVWIAQRYITRPSSADEGSRELSEDDYARMAATGAFALHWRSHGFGYGIGTELDEHLSLGHVVVVNGARRCLPQACERYPALQAVQVTVDAAVLYERLVRRGRENAVQIAGRLADAGLPLELPPGVTLHRIENNDVPAKAAGELVCLVRRLAVPVAS